MKIELITQEEYQFIKDCYTKYPALIFQNNGYEYLDVFKLNKEDISALNQISKILSKSIVGFKKFNNLRFNKNNEMQLRFQYDWTAHDRSMGIPFTGVGYILLDELLNGFNKNEN